MTYRYNLYYERLAYTESCSRAPLTLDRILRIYSNLI